MRVRGETRGVTEEVRVGAIQTTSHHMETRATYGTSGPHL